MTSVQYGDGKFSGIIFPFGLGAFPSTMTLLGIPETLPRTGTVSMGSGIPFAFHNCVLQDVTEINGMAACHIQDRRALLRGSSSKAEINVPLSDGTIRYERSPQSMASQLLDDMGEVGYDVSAMPNDARPFMRWKGEDARDALDDLCDRVGCRIGLTIENTMKVYRVGTGAMVPAGGFNDSNSYDTGDYPLNIGVEFAPTVYQGRLLLEAVMLNSDENFDTISGVLGVWTEGAAKVYAPWVGFPGLTTDSERDLAERSAFRIYRIKNTRESSSLAVPNLGTIASIDLIFPVNDYQVDRYTTDSFSGRHSAEVIGKFFSGEDCGVTHAALTRYPFPFHIVNGEFVVFDRPVFKTGSSGITEVCDELYLETSYNVRLSSTSEHIRRIHTRSQTGDVARLDHRIQQPFYASYTEVYDAAGAVTSVSDNTAVIDAWASNLIDDIEPVLRQKEQRSQMYTGFVPFNPDGRNWQVTWMAGIPGSHFYDGVAHTLIGRDSEPYEGARSYYQIRKGH